MAGLRAKLIMRIAALGAATMGLSACYYDAGLGLGYYDDGYDYGGSYYDCDPYSPFDRYYDCDYRGGFYNIGYGGGWYQDYWYPGYGFYIFDRGGRRYKMYDHHRRYWGSKRHEWYRNHYGRRDGGHGWKNRDGHRNDGDNRNMWQDGNRRRNDSEGRRDRWRDGDRQNGGVATPTDNGQAVDRPVWNRDRDRRNGEGRQERRRQWPGSGWQGNGGNAVPAPEPVAGQADAPPAARGPWRRNGGAGQEGRPAPQPRMRERGNWQSQAPQQIPQQPAPPPARANRPARPDVEPQRAPRNPDNRQQEN